MTDIEQQPDLGVAKIDPVKEFFAHPSVMNKFQDILGKKAQGFITSVLQITSGSDKLKACLPKTIFTAAATAATMDLPINPNLGFAWIVPYKGSAQFQMGYKGYIQLAMRTGQYLRMNCIEIYENQFKSWNKLTEELELDMKVEGEGKIVGYCAYFKLINGFEKTVFWTVEKVNTHARKYSKNFGGDNSLWKEDFDSMAKKTVLKHTLSKWGILSVEMQIAMKVDQAVINDENANDVSYPDSQEEEDQSKKNSQKATDETINFMNTGRRRR